MRDDFDKMLQELFGGGGNVPSAFEGGDWLPSVDVSETEDAIEVQVDLPGMKPEDVEVSVTDNLLTIKGERREESEDKKKHRVERRYGSFYRSISLPAGTEAEKIAATSENGVLSISIPKTPEKQPKKIQVKPK
jgi:HSP20 family protein